MYRFSCEIFKRGERSILGRAAYNSRSRLLDPHSQHSHNFTARGDLVHAEISAPSWAPDRFRDRQSLWSAVEEREIRRDAQLARSIQLALPRALGHDQQIALVRQFVLEQFVASGMVVDWSLHDPVADGERQPHAHLLLTLRRIDGEGFGLKVREWNSPGLLVQWREAWAAAINRMMDQCGLNVGRVDHRRLCVQRAEIRGAIGPHRSRDECDRLMALETRVARVPARRLSPTAFRDPNHPAAVRSFERENRNVDALIRLHEEHLDWSVELDSERIFLLQDLAGSTAQVAPETVDNLRGASTPAPPEPVLTCEERATLAQAEQVDWDALVKWNEDRVSGVISMEATMMVAPASSSPPLPQAPSPMQKVLGDDGLLAAVRRRRKAPEDAEAAHSSIAAAIPAFIQPYIHGVERQASQDGAVPESARVPSEPISPATQPEGIALLPEPLGSSTPASPKLRMAIQAFARVLASSSARSQG